MLAVVTNGTTATIEVNESWGKSFTILDSWQFGNSWVYSKSWISDQVPNTGA